MNTCVKGIFFRLTGLVFLILSCTVSAETLHDTITETYTLKQLGLDRATTLNGYKPAKTLYLPTPSSASIKSLVLHLKLNFSEALKDGSQVEFYFNQQLVRRLGLDDSGARESVIDIELPLTQLSKDWQQLEFSATFFSARNLCDPNVWIYIDPKSTLTATWTRSTFDGRLNELPAPFVSSGAIYPTKVLALLPLNPLPQELFSLLRVALYLGTASPDGKVRFTTGFVGQTGALLSTHQLLLTGLRDSLFGASAPLQAEWLQNPIIRETREALTTPDTGALALAPSPFNPFLGVLVITGDSLKGLQKASKALLIPEFIKLAAGHSTLVNKAWSVNGASNPAEYLDVSLKSLGYDDRSVSGLGHHVLEYDVHLPNNKVPQGATLTTMVTSPVIDGEKDDSLITLMVNGKRQGVFRIRNLHSEWKTTLKADALKPGRNRIQYLMDLHLNNEECSRQTQKEIWATIHAESHFSATFSDVLPKASINQFPVPFAGEVAVIIPDDAPKQMYDALVRLMFKIGQLFAPDIPHFSFYTAGMVDEAFVREHNTVLIGEPSSNPWVKLLFDYLPVTLHPDARHFVTKQSQLNLKTSETTGLLALLPSPWSKKTTILLITGDSMASVFRAVHAFTKDSERMRLDGNIAVINEDESIRFFDGYNIRYAAFHERLSESLLDTTKNLFFYLRQHPQIIMYLLVLLVTLGVYLKRRKK